MLLTIALGLFTTLVGVVLGCTVLELTLRALGQRLSERPKRLLRRRAGSQWPTEA